MPLAISVNQSGAHERWPISCPSVGGVVNLIESRNGVPRNTRCFHGCWTVNIALGQGACSCVERIY